MRVASVEAATEVETVTAEELRFRRALHLWPDDEALRLAYTLWLAERGDWRADGYRWMMEHGKRPFDWASCRVITGYSSFDWYLGEGAIWDVPASCTLPELLWRLLDPRRIDTNSCSAYGTAREAEEALCRVFSAVGDGWPPAQMAVRMPRRRRFSA